MSALYYSASFNANERNILTDKQWMIFNIVLKDPVACIYVCVCVFQKRNNTYRFQTIFANLSKTIEPAIG